MSAAPGTLYRFLKWALPFALVLAALAWMAWTRPREAVMIVKSITRVDPASVVAPTATASAEQSP